MTPDNGPHDAGSIAIVIDDWVFGHTLTEKQYALIKECVDPIVAELTRLRARVGVLEGENRTLRRKWCFEYAGVMAYMNDGEAKDSRVHPWIDFIRDSVDEIERKMRERFVSAVEARSKASRKGGG